jgi:hypothetical protein
VVRDRSRRRAISATEARAFSRSTESNNWSAAETFISTDPLVIVPKSTTHLRGSALPNDELLSR